jgi:hypothetical protein
LQQAPSQQQVTYLLTIDITIIIITVAQQRQQHLEGVQQRRQQLLATVAQQLQQLTSRLE